MEKARGLLENTNMKMYEISSRVGYENAAYFSAAFKRYYGKSPSEYQSRR
ncbi:MAG: helix-turn-helix domain-containing protein [Enterocloster clostridioformis]|jgi:two-component system response regulator YesN|nr:helix-turn-helix domain-containing protein [Enterocloster clostridioformis]MCA5578616.1 helix-turn-helix domain-containing protein [Enterocloster clostridioformis]MCI7607648.1 helix-turn-helix domain-containing protein [Enterocloster clostridioformis]